MNKRQRTYDILKLMLWIGAAELIFWILFFTSNIGLAKIKSEHWKSSFLVYENPRYFWFLLVVPIFIVIYLINLYWKNRVLEKYFSIKQRERLFSLISEKQSFWRFFILRTAVVFLIFGMANPQAGSKHIDVESFGGEIIVAVDVSRSMLVKDMQQSRSRLDAAKNALNNMTQHMPGASLGIVAFAGTAYAHLPLTKDLQSVSMYIQDLSTDLIRSQGTDIGGALEAAVNSLSIRSDEKVIYLLTDGEDHEGFVDTALDRAKSLGATVHVIAFGTKNGGPIPEKKGGVKKDKNGEVIVSKPNFELLKNIADATGGMFSIETNAFPNTKSLMEKTYQRDKKNTQRLSTKKNHGSFFALLAFLLFGVYLFLLNQYKSQKNA
jgi:Ca-activated chloride channel family protein